MGGEGNKSEIKGRFFRRFEELLSLARLEISNERSRDPSFPSRPIWWIEQEIKIEKRANNLLEIYIETKKNTCEHSRKSQKSERKRETTVVHLLSSLSKNLTHLPTIPNNPTTPHRIQRPRRRTPLRHTPPSSILVSATRMRRVPSSSSQRSPMSPTPSSTNTQATSPTPTTSTNAIQLRSQRPRQLMPFLNEMRPRSDSSHRRAAFPSSSSAAASYPFRLR